MVCACKPSSMTTKKGRKTAKKRRPWRTWLFPFLGLLRRHPEVGQDPHDAQRRHLAGAVVSPSDVHRLQTGLRVRRPRGAMPIAGDGEALWRGIPRPARRYSLHAGGAALLPPGAASHGVNVPKWELTARPFIGHLRAHLTRRAPVEPRAGPPDLMRSFRGWLYATPTGMDMQKGGNVTRLPPATNCDTAAPCIHRSRFLR